MEVERNIVVDELDRPLAECRAIMFALRSGYVTVEIIKKERIEGAWRFLARLQTDTIPED